MKRHADNPAAKKWFKNQSEDQKAAWYVKHKAKNGDGGLGDSKKRAFDEVDYEESHSKSAIHSDIDVDDFIPFEEWAIRQKILSPNETMVQLGKRFQALVDDPDHPTRRRGKEYLVFVCIGMGMASPWQPHKRLPLYLHKKQIINIQKHFYPWPQLEEQIPYLCICSPCKSITLSRYEYERCL